MDTLAANINSEAIISDEKGLISVLIELSEIDIGNIHI